MLNIILICCIFSICPVSIQIYYLYKITRVDRVIPMEKIQHMEMNELFETK